MSPKCCSPWGCVRRYHRRRCSRGNWVRWSGRLPAPFRQWRIAATTAAFSRRNSSARTEHYLLQILREETICSKVTPVCPWRRSEEHTSELQSLMRISYAVFCLKKKNKTLESEHLPKM